MKIYKVMSPVSCVLFPIAYIRTLQQQYGLCWEEWREQGLPLAGRLASLFFNAWAYNILWLGACEMAYISAVDRHDSHWLRDQIFREAGEDYFLSRKMGFSRMKAFHHAWNSIWYGPVPF